jgi:hypothetical protein
VDTVGRLLGVLDGDLAEPGFGEAGAVLRYGEGAGDAARPATTLAVGDRCRVDVVGDRRGR